MSAHVRPRRPFLFRAFLAAGIVLFAGFAAVVGIAAYQQAQAARENARTLACHELQNMIDIWHGGLTAALEQAIDQRRQSQFQYRLSNGLIQALTPDDAPEMASASVRLADHCLGVPGGGSRNLANTGMTDIRVETGNYVRNEQDYALARMRFRSAGGAAQQLDVGFPISSKAAVSLPGLGLIGLLALTTVFAVGLLAQRNFEGRIAVFNRTFESFVAGRRATRTSLGTENDELAELGRNINASLDRIQGLVDEQQRFNLQVAHDFRRPLTGILLDIGELLETTTEAETRNQLQSISDRIVDLKDAFDHVLDSPVEEFEPLCLSDLLYAVSSEFTAKARSKGLELTCTAAANVWVQGSRSSLVSLLENLLDNAVKYTRAGSVSAHLETDGPKFVLSIRDTGPGMPDDLAKELLQPFRRGRQHEAVEGHGLGLAFVVSSALRHGFAVRHANLNPGLEVSICGSCLPQI